MGYYNSEEAAKLQRKFGREELQKALKDAKKDLQDLPLYIIGLEEQLQILSKVVYQPIILLYDDTKVKLFNGPINLSLEPYQFVDSGLEVMREFSTNGFNKNEALACIGELIKRFAIPRNRIVVDHHHYYDDEKYTKYINQTIDKLFQNQHGTEEEKLKERPVRVEYLTKFGRELAMFVFPAQGILSYNQLELCDLLRPELTKINLSEERMHKGYVSTQREGNQLMWTVTFFLNMQEKERKIFNVGDKVRIKDTPSSYGSIPYHGYEGIVYGHHKGKYWGDGMRENELLLITIELEDGRKMAIGVDIDDVE